MTEDMNEMMIKMRRWEGWGDIESEDTAITS
jgi:hypothetical protein